METFTKAWFLKYQPHLGQRTVELMEKHRAKTGASGNCFDLAIWLIHEFGRAGIQSYAIGEHLGEYEAHVGVMALDQDGRRYLCDLGDLWIQPLCIDQTFTEAKEGYFTGARIEFTHSQKLLSVKYLRSNGKFSEQSYNLTPITLSQLIEAGEISQKTLSPPLVEMRINEGGEIVHWEYDGGSSYFSRMHGPEKEPACESLQFWSRRISQRTGMDASYVQECLEAIEELSKKMGLLS
jgi:hypothetical protein